MNLTELEHRHGPKSLAPVHTAARYAATGIAVTNACAHMALPGPAAALAKLSRRLVSWTDEHVRVVAIHGHDPLDDHSQTMRRTGPPVTGGGEPETRRSLHDKMNGLLDRAVEQTAHDSRIELYGRIIEQLVADEARIVGALSDGSSSPLVNVYAAAPMRGARRVVLEHASLIGRTAGVALPGLAATYVAHLLALGLVEVGGEDPAMTTEYEILMNERTVLRAMNIASTGPSSARVERRSLKLSPLGRDLWDATMTSAPAEN
ncbi:hypothetical protein GCM10009856_20690 [Mycolicibacterium llatzerense]